MRSCFAWARARRDVSLTRANGRNFPESVDDRI
jgi:hypothetical protein